MKVYVKVNMGGKIEVRTGESLEREQNRLVEQYLKDKDIFNDFLDNHYLASDFYYDKPEEEEVKDNFEIYCKDCAAYDTFGQYALVIVDEIDKKEAKSDEELPF